MNAIAIDEYMDTLMDLIEQEDDQERRKALCEAFDAANDIFTASGHVTSLDRTVDTSPPPADDDSIETRVNLSLAVGRYLRNSQRFNEASHEFTKAAKALRNSLGKSKKYVTRVEGKDYIVSSDRDGNFEVDPIARI